MKKPDDLETRILQVLDDNIRLIQYSVYAVGLIGLAVVAKSTHAFKKFACSKDIPKEFISKAVKLQGKVKGIECLQHQLVGEQVQHFTVRLNVEHVPVATFKLWKTKPETKNTSLLKVELLGVRPSLEGVNKWIKPSLESNPFIWFRLYGVNNQENLLYAVIIVKRTWWKFWKPKDLSLIVLQENEAVVAPYFPSRQISFNNKYAAYYRRLLYSEIKYMKKKS